MGKDIKNLHIDFFPKATYVDYIFSKTPLIFSMEQLIQEIDKNLSSIPRNLIDRFNDENWECIITNRRDLEREYGYSYKVFGITDFTKKQIIIYATPEALYYSLPHEFGHFLDYTLGTISDSGKWAQIHKQDSFEWKRTVANADREEFFPEIDNKHEYFADAFLFYCKSKDKLKWTRDTYDVIEKAIYALPFCKVPHHIII